MNVRLSFVVLALFITFYSQAQDSTASNIQHIPSKFLTNISANSKNVAEQLDKKSQKTLAKFQKQEDRIKRMLLRRDSPAASTIFGDANTKYQELEQKLNASGKLSQYIPHLDTISSSLNFLTQNSQLLSHASGVQDKLKSAISKVDALKEQLQKAESLKQFLKQRKQYLKDQLSKLGLTKPLKKLNKQVYYYDQQVKEYIAIFKDSKKVERKAIDLLSKTKAFQSFMRKNSALASMFRMPGNDDDPISQASLAGLQTRAQVNGLIQNQLASGGPNARATFSENMQQAQSQLNQLKAKMAKLGGNTSDADMPDGFKANDQKIKSFFKRLEVGTNIQTQSARYYFPVTSDLGLSVGYKINDKSIIGIGASYKLGLGNGWKHIRLSQEGAALRSYIDWKIRGSLSMSGGYEINYRTRFNSVEQLKNLNAWQRSGLVGLSKLLPIKSKFFKKTKLQLLWDFMSYEQLPRTQPILFRLNYTFK